MRKTKSDAFFFRISDTRADRIRDKRPSRQEMEEALTHTKASRVVVARATDRQQSATLHATGPGLFDGLTGTINAHQLKTMRYP